MPSLSLQTVYFHESDRAEAIALGRQLFHLLGRPHEDPLIAGVRIAVYFGVEANMVDTRGAARTILIPVIGSTAYLTQRDAVLTQINAWSLAPDGTHVFPLLRSRNWRTLESTMRPKPFLGELFGGSRQRTIDAICIAAIKCIEGDDAVSKARLFLSHAKVDLEKTQWAAKEIQKYVAGDVSIQAFFDSVDLLAGEGLKEQVEEAQALGVFVALRTDHYSSRLWCQAELIQAKRNRRPVLTVEMLDEGEIRSGAYSGNGPTVVWNESPEEVVSAALVTWLRHVVFQADGQSLINGAALPGNTEVLTRAPELLDLAQEPLAAPGAAVVLHPDPPLPSVERAILRSIKPKLSTVTPSTAYRYLLERDGGSTASVLDNWKIGLSLSNDATIDPSRGLYPEHVQDVTVAIARALISSGAHIAYGGDFRRSGYTLLLNDVYSAYNESLDEDRRFLHSYVGACIPIEEIPELGGVTLHHMGLLGGKLKPRIKPPAEGVLVNDVLRALYFSDMRRAMAKDEQGRIIVAGALTPRSSAVPGYGGAFPGVVEEAWRTLRQDNKPLYVIGGFGGAAAAVAALLRGDETPRLLTMSHWKKRAPDFVERAESISRHPLRKVLGLPKSMRKLVERVRTLGADRLHSDERSLEWNGLTRDENFELFECIDPTRINALIMKGFLHKAKSDTHEKLSIELVDGDIRTASTSRIVAVATFEDAPLSGAALAIDRLLGGAVESARTDGVPFQSIQDENSAYDYLFQVNLGPLDDLDKLSERVESESRALATVLRRHDFKRVAVVTFGGASAEHHGHVVRGMLDGLIEAAGYATIEWYEFVSTRFDALKEVFSNDDNVHYSMRQGSPVAGSAPPQAAGRTVVNVALNGATLRTTVLHPQGTGTSLMHSASFDEAELERLSRGAGKKGRSAPNSAALHERGTRLARLLFGDSADDLLRQTSSFPMVIQHDLASAQIPFEVLGTGKGEGESEWTSMALEGGIQRRLLVESSGRRVVQGPARRDGNLTVLLIDDPTDNLPGAVFEAKQVKRALRNIDGVRLIELHGQDATRAAFKEAMLEADVLHYAGHGFYRGSGGSESGICLSDGNLTRQELGSSEFRARVVILNACEVGRVRGTDDPRTTSTGGPVPSQAATLTGSSIRASSFAEFFLASGVEALLGTYWTVKDVPAARFMTELYEQLASGSTLSDAVIAARAVLHSKGESDWANYVQYGDGRFRLLQPW